MNKAHTNINWQDDPSEATAINEVNLNKMDNSIDVIDDRVITLDNQRQTDEYNISQLQDTASTQGTAISTLQSSVASQGSAITALQNGKVDKSNGMGLSTLMNLEAQSRTNTGTIIGALLLDKYGQQVTEIKLRNGIEVDSALSTTSENPVQNKVVKNALDGKVDKISGKGLFNLSNMQFYDDTTMVGEVIAHIIMHSQNPDPLEPDMEFDIYNGIEPITNAQIDALE